jgi:hypothetical protein
MLRSFQTGSTGLFEMWTRRHSSGLTARPVVGAFSCPFRIELAGVELEFGGPEVQPQSMANLPN